MLGCGVVWLTNKQGSEQNPVTALNAEPLDDRITQGERDGQAQRMAK
ncbi:Uncharacterised protein [Vibrio cholerae]|nr:Uncharacterised protein [Vibrio cholerae]